MHKAMKKISAIAATSLLAIGGTVAATAPASAANLECGDISFVGNKGLSTGKYIDHKCTGKGKVTYSRECSYGLINKSVSASYNFTGGTKTARILLDCGIAKNTGKVTYTVS